MWSPRLAHWKQIKSPREILTRLQHITALLPCIYLFIMIRPLDLAKNDIWSSSRLSVSIFKYHPAECLLRLLQQISHLQDSNIESQIRFENVGRWPRIWVSSCPLFLKPDRGSKMHLAALLSCQASVSQEEELLHQPSHPQLWPHSPSQRQEEPAPTGEQ